jgi:CubicO group peptidase (beta-lactamase class C family)
VCGALALSFGAMALAQPPPAVQGRNPVAELGLTPLQAPPAPDAPAVWPTIDWESGVARVSDEARLESLLDVVDADHPELGQTRAILIVQNGRIVIERYAPGYDSQTRLVSWSMAKSFTQALLGIAVKQGRVDLDAPMGSPRWSPDDPRQAITWRQWINMTDGLRYTEIGSRSPAVNGAAVMTFSPEHRRDVIGFATALPLVHAPGTRWNYSTASINLVADALTRALTHDAALPPERRAAMLSWMQRDLFERIGMWRAQPEFDAQGTFLGGSLIYATAREFAKFGFLYLHEGVWDGEPILPEGWTRFARERPAGVQADIYGAGWWRVAESGPGTPQPSLPPQGPRDVFSAQGHLGQLIVVVPSRDLVMVRLGVLPGQPDDWDQLGEWVGEVIALFPEASGRAAMRSAPLNPDANAGGDAEGPPLIEEP